MEQPHTAQIRSTNNPASTSNNKTNSFTHFTFISMMRIVKNMSNKQFVVLVLSVALTILVFARLFIFPTAPVENIVVSPERLAMIHTQARHFDNKTAFAFGGQGIYSTTELFKCFSAMESLSKIGGWKGDIYFLVDHEDCIDKNLLKSLDNKNIHIVKVKNERKDGSTGGSSSRRLFNQQPFERSMAIKTLILDHIESPTVELVLWYDCDVLFVKKDCVAEMLSKKPQITKQRPIFISMDNHVGSVAVNKSVSHDALRLWHDGILSSNSASSMGSQAAVPDYAVFSKLFGSKSAEPDAKFGVFDPIWADSFPRSLPNNGTIYSSTTQCALHLSSGRCNHLGAKNIHEVVSNYHLNSYKNHFWCPNANRRNFKKYGIDWPFCWDPPLIFNQ